LLEQGWTEKEIEDGFAQVKKPQDYKLKNEPKTERHVVHNIPIKHESNIMIPQTTKELKEEDIAVPLPPKARQN
jgi:hypothetical protein